MSKFKNEAKKFKAKVINGWSVGDYLGNGKTAFVCKATKDTKIAAIKVFPSGDFSEEQRKELETRIKRQLLLVDKEHPNLVKIFDGGYDINEAVYFIVMEYIDALPLDSIIKSIPRDEISNIIKQIADAAKFLEGLQFVHRDIKPENIVVSQDFKKATLLDFGVIRHFKDESITDTSTNLNFVGTLRYSSPEFLLRKEKNTDDDWRAITFYQIGAVLHDLIMRKPIFSGCDTPYAVLVNAIQKIDPEIDAHDVDPRLIYLAKACLQKKPKARLDTVSWESFESVKKTSMTIEDKKELIKRNLSLSKSEIDSESDIQIDKQIRLNSEGVFKKMVHILSDRKIYPKHSLQKNESSDTIILYNIMLYKSPHSHLKFNVHIELSGHFANPNSIVLKVVDLHFGLIKKNEYTDFEIFKGLIEDNNLDIKLEDFFLDIVLKSQDVEN